MNNENQKSADPCLPGGARPEAVSQNKQHRTNTRRACRRQLEVRIEPQSCIILFFYRFWTRSTHAVPVEGNMEVRIDPQSILFFYRFWTPSFQRRSKKGVLELARPCCFPVSGRAFLGRLLGQKSWFCPSWRPNATEGANGAFRRQLDVQIEPQSCIILFFYTFWTQRLTLKIIPTQVEKRCPWARQAMLFPRSGASLFWEGFWVRSRGFARHDGQNHDSQTQRKVPTVHFEGNWRCRLSPTTAKSSFFIGSGRNVWHWRSFQRRSKNGPWARQAMLFPRSGASLFGKAFGSEVVVLPVVTPKRNGRCQRCISKAIGGANWAPQLQNPLFFYRFWTQRLTLKIIPTQVEKRCPWARQAMLFPRSGASLFGKAFGSEVVVLPVVTPKRNGRCQRCISKAIGRANWAPKLYNPLFLKVLDATFDIGDHSNAGRKTVSLSSPGCFPVPGRAFLGMLLGQKSWFCPSWRPNATEGANVPTVHFEGNWRCKLSPKAVL